MTIYASVNVILIEICIQHYDKINTNALHTLRRKEGKQYVKR